ncbi:MAG: hypothetical protein V7459_17425, partial [Oceanicoccus sp.]
FKAYSTLRVEDSANGKDVYAAFAVRMGLLIMVTVYVCIAVYALEYLNDSYFKDIQPSSS